MFYKRFKDFRERLTLTQSDIAKVLKVKPSAISQLESDKIKLSLDNLIILSDTYNLNLHWLLTGSGEMFVEHYQPLANPNDVYVIPVIAEISAGEPLAIYDDGQFGTVDVPKSLSLDAKNLIAFKVNGRSMEPTVMHNDVVVIRKRDDWENLKQKICALRINGEITLKKLIPDHNNRLFILESINKMFDPIIVDPAYSEFYLLGEMTYLFRRC